MATGKRRPPRVDAQQERAMWWIRRGLADMKAGEQVVVQGIALARHCGVTYKRIGQELGVSAQAVQKKYPGTSHELLERFMLTGSPDVVDPDDDDEDELARLEAELLEDGEDR